MRPSSTVALAILFLLRDASSSDTCYRDPTLSRASRLEAVKDEILLRLGLREEPRNPENASAIANDPDFLREYYLLKKNQELSESHTPCANLDFLTKETLQFHPQEVERRRPIPRIAHGDDCASKFRAVMISAKALMQKLLVLITRIFFVIR